MWLYIDGHVRNPWTRLITQPPPPPLITSHRLLSVCRPNRKTHSNCDHLIEFLSSSSSPSLNLPPQVLFKCLFMYSCLLLLPCLPWPRISMLGGLVAGVDDDRGALLKCYANRTIVKRFAMCTIIIQPPTPPPCRRHNPLRFNHSISRFHGCCCDSEMDGRRSHDAVAHLLGVIHPLSIDQWSLWHRCNIFLVQNAAISGCNWLTDCWTAFLRTAEDEQTCGRTTATGLLCWSWCIPINKLNLVFLEYGMNSVAKCDRDEKCYFCWCCSCLWDWGCGLTCTEEGV